MEIVERCARVLRALPPGVMLVAAAKGRTAEEVRAAAEAGIRHVGENYVQEAERKKSLLPPDLTWHMIGRLQTNKASKAAAVFDWVQTLDSHGLAQKLSAAAQRTGKSLSVLIQVNIGREAQKAGVLPEEVLPLVEAICPLPGLQLRGLMALPPEPTAAEDSRPYFQAMRQLFEDLRTKAVASALDVLSMGTSTDWEVAVEEGATMVRLGTLLFGPRR